MSTPTTVRTEADSVARLTSASRTPGTDLRAFSTRATHDAQVIPSTSRSKLVSPTVYPAFSTALESTGNSMSGAAITVADSVVRFTVASMTPATAFRLRSTRATQDAQVMPSMGSVQACCAGPVMEAESAVFIVDLLEWQRPTGLHAVHSQACRNGKVKQAFDALARPAT